MGYSVKDLINNPGEFYLKRARGFVAFILLLAFGLILDEVGLGSWAAAIFGLILLSQLIGGGMAAVQSAEEHFFGDVSGGGPTQ